MNDRATAYAVSLFLYFLVSTLLLLSPGDLSAQPSTPERDTSVRPQRADPMFRFKERPETPQTSPSGGSGGGGGGTTTPQQAPAAARQRAVADPMRFQAAPPPTTPPAQAETRSQTPPPQGRPVAATPKKATSDPMRFQPAPPTESPKETPPPAAERSIASAPKDKAAPAPMRSQPAPRFEVRGPETAAEEVYPGPDEEIPVDEMPQFNPAELVRNVNYPDNAIREGIQGRVLVRALVNRNGGVLRRIVEYSSNPALDTAAVAAVSATKFKPAKWKGVAVAAWITVPVNFILAPVATEPRR